MMNTRTRTSSTPGIAGKKISGKKRESSAAAKRTPRRPAARGGILAAVHESAVGLHSAGVISQTTMREYDALCLAPIEEFKPEQIAALRKRVAVSQPVFAAYLNVGKTTVSQWERGEKKPDGAARKLLDLVRRKGLDVLA